MGHRPPKDSPPRARPHPLTSLIQSITLQNTPSPTLGRTFISGGTRPGSPFLTLTEQLRNNPHWHVW